jgi:uncharacterized protein with FMN-binding domain
MKKILTSIVLIGAVAGYVIYQQMGGQSVSTIDNKNNQSGQAVDTKQVLYKDGEYTGPVVDAYYGNLQVKAIIQNGLLTDVQFLQFPMKKGNTFDISNNSMPILKAEAIQTQSADVNIISGATQTVEAFHVSLAGALLLAKAQIR